MDTPAPHTTEAPHSRRERAPTRTLAQAQRAFWRFASPRIIAALILASFVVRLALGGWSLWDAALAAAVVLYWPLQEWFLHRFVLHMRPLRWRGRTFDPVFARIHRAHHADPSRFGLVLLPWHTPPAAYALFLALLAAALPSWGLALSAMTAISAMALLYEWVHFMTHCDYKPRSAYMQRIWRNHRLHHYKNEHHWYSFTAPPVDEWFGTGGDHEQVPRSETCRTLGVD